MSAAADPLAGIGTPVGTPPPASSSDPLAGLGAPVGAAPATTSAPDEDSFGQQASEAWQGVKKGGAETLSTLGKLFTPAFASDPATGKPLTSALDLAPEAKSKIESAAAAPVPDTIAGKTGYGLENIAEFMLGDEAVKGMSVGEKLAHLAPVMKTMEKYPRIAEAVQTGLKAMGIGTAQAGVHGAGPVQALESGAVGGVTAGALEGGVSALAGAAQRAAPAVEKIAGEDVQTLSSQRPGTGPRGSVKVGEVPKVGAAQQEAAPRVFRNIAQRATHDALEEANLSRVGPTPITDPARLLAPPEDMRPYPFTIEGPGAVSEETPAGSTPRTKQIGTEYVPGKGSGTAAKTEPYNEGAFKYGDEEPLPPVNDQEPFQGPTHKEPILQYLTSLKPGQEAGSTSVTGGGDLVAADPETAQAHLSRLNELVDNPPEEASPGQMSAIQSARDNLQEQMDMYNSHQRTLPNFSPLNASRAAESVGHFGDAADQLQNAAQPIYQKFDELTDDKFSDLNRARAAAGKRGDFPAKHDYENQIDQLIDKTPGISQGDRLQATKLWNKSKVLDGLNDVINHAANVDDKYASQVAGGRVLSGVRMQNGLKQLINRYGNDRLESVIGKDGMENMTRMADLLNTPKAAQGLKGMSMSVLHNVMHGKVGGALGVAIGYHMGGYEGSLAGAYAGAKAERWMLQMAATSPRVGQLLDYAVRNNVTPKVAAGLISSAMIQENQTQQEPEKEGQQ
jgi:hypothetical protein